MIFAINNSERIEAQPGLKGKCPNCLSPVIAKCGTINVWHWAHISMEDCDHWSEPESEWHKAWKDNFPRENREVVIKPHRADIKINGLVIELQNSSISTIEMLEREFFYGRMIWIINGVSFENNLTLNNKGDFYGFRWKHPRKGWTFSKRPIFIEMSTGLFMVKKIDMKDKRCIGWGKFVDKDEFISSLK